MLKALGLCLALCLTAYPAAELDFHLPFEKYKLPNGLRVILSRDTTVPVTAVYMIYDVGSRTEEKRSVRICAAVRAPGSR